MTSKHNLKEKISSYQELVKGHLKKSKFSPKLNNTHKALLTSLPCVMLVTPLVAQQKTALTIANDSFFVSDNGNGTRFLDVDGGFGVGNNHAGFKGTSVGADLKVRIQGTNIQFYGFNGANSQMITNNSSTAKRYTAQFVIDSNDNFNAKAKFLTFSNGSNFASWANDAAVTGYVGFKFLIGASTHYGWAQIRVTEEDVAGNKGIELLAFAYNQTAGNSVTSHILPVELTSFTATSLEKNVQLNWATAMEKNNAGFEVERSDDGENFKPLTFIVGNGSTLEHHEYGYTDETIKYNQLYFYRLKQIDHSGEFEYSDIVTAKVERNAGIIGNVYPNPTSGSVRLDYASTDNAELVVTVFDMMGQELGREVRSIVTGMNDLSFDFSAVGKGNFFVKLEANGETSYQKLTIH